MIDLIQGKEILDDAFLESSSKRLTMKRMLDLYLGEVPIKQRVLANPHKVNNKLANDFYGTIIDDKVGYMGNNISVVVDKNYSDEEYDRITQFLDDWKHRNDIDDLNADTVKYASICGVAGRLLYNSKDGARIRNVPNPWEIYVKYDDDTGDILYSVWFYDKVEKERGVRVTNQYAELYDEKNMYLYKRQGGAWVIENTIVHFFEGVPLFLILNNSEMMGDYQKSTELIDAYNRAISDGSSEFEQLRLAYLVLISNGVQIDAEFTDKMKQTGLLPLPEGGDVKFITKNIDMTSIKILLDELRRNIFSFCKSVDFSQDLGGDMRVIGWQTKLMPLENKCKITERKFISALRYQYKLLCGYWKQFAGIDINYLDLSWQFTRNIPRDIDSEAETLGKLSGFVSQSTALSLMSFIDNPEKEMEKMEQEREVIDLDDVTSDEEDRQTDNESGSLPTETA